MQVRRQRRSRTDAIPRIRLELYFVVEHKSRHMLLHRASDSPRVPVMLRSGGTFLSEGPLTGFNSVLLIRIN